MSEVSSVPRVPSRSADPLSHSYTSYKVRKLHTDKVAPSPRGPFSSVVDDNDCSEANQYRTSIARIIEQGCPRLMLLEKLEELSAWLRTQPHEQVRRMKAKEVKVHT
jgi:hypothetical protein